jgi:hypothetical protein
MLIITLKCVTYFRHGIVTAMMSESAFEKRRWQSPNELIDNAGFRWPVAASGYRWEDERAVYPRRAPPGGAGPGRVLVPVDPRASHGDKYDPLAEGGLFVTFANTPTTEDGLLQFANRWGYLYAHCLVTPWHEWSDPHAAPAALATERGRYTLVAVERFAEWRGEVIVMRDALDLWGMYSRGERKRVARRLREDIYEFGRLRDAQGARKASGNDEDGGNREDPQLRYFRSLHWCVDLLLPGEDQHFFRTDFTGFLAFFHTGESIAGHDQMLATMKRLDRVLAAAPEPVLEVALHLLQEKIDDRLSEETHARLKWDGRRNRPVLGLAPRSLLGAMWLQFAQEVIGQASHRPCKVCGKWLTLSTDDYGFRSDREFCSAACRQKDYRAKIKEARRLKADGWAVRRIAKQFNTTTDTIKYWLTKEKRHGTQAAGTGRRVDRGSTVRQVPGRAVGR